MSDYKAPSPEYAGPPHSNSGTGNKPINHITIHSTVSRCEPGGARATAAYFRKATTGSAHYVVDPAEVIQAAYDDVICWHAPPNQHSLGIEMCEYPDQNIERWKDKNHSAMLERVAHLTARLCLAYDVPAQWLSPADLKAGKKGITSHNNVSDAFHQSDHWDPGAFPHETFIGMVQDNISRIKKKHAAVASHDDKPRK